jgi:Zn-dependent peptidase ImmA (M78 family)/transcriptional regulator with XRE-family HTH domain
MRPGTPGFHGERLREAREARGLTATTLAGLIDVTRAAVSQYESGTQSPAPQVMQAIARVLNLPVEFFLCLSALAPTEVVFYRSMSSATKRARTRAERRYAWLREIVALLRGYIQFPRVRFPSFDVPPDPAALTWTIIERLASETRRHFDLGDGPVSNVAWLLENHGAVVARCDLDAGPLDAFSEWRNDEGMPYVILNAGKDSAARSRFDIAHELGHMVLHRHLPRVPQREDHLFKMIENQANRFASAFLLPADSFRADLGVLTLDRCVAIKSKWRVSVQAMLMRAGQIGVVSVEQEKRHWMNLGRRKWRTREPLDDSLPPEHPKFLAKSVELLVRENIVDPLDIPRRVTLAASDVEELAGLPPGFLGASGPHVRLIGGDDRRHIIPFEQDVR